MRRGYVVLIAPALAVALAAAGTGRLQRRRSVQERTAELEAQVAQLLAAQRAVEGRLERLRLELDRAVEPLRVQLADQGETLRSLEARLVAMQERWELLGERLAELDERLAGGGPRQQPTATGAPMPPPERPAGLPGPTAVPRTAPARSEADELYSAAYTDYLRGDYALAIEGFSEYLRRYPEAASADNAQYWIGESLYAQGRYLEARSAFQEVLRRYPDSDAAADALYKAARCLVELGDADTAAEELLTLVAAHPATDAAAIACLELERLGVEPPPACPSP